MKGQQRRNWEQIDLWLLDKRLEAPRKLDPEIRKEVTKLLTRAKSMINCSVAALVFHRCCPAQILGHHKRCVVSTFPMQLERKLPGVRCDDDLLQDRTQDSLAFFRPTPPDGSTDAPTRRPMRIFPARSASVIAGV